MITNLPSGSEYQKIAIECWVQAFDTLFETDKYVTSLELDEELSEQINEFSQPSYRTAIVLLHQGIESIMKSKICDSSPLLLIDNKRTDWPVLPSHRDKDYNEFFTVGAESLLHTYCAVSNGTVEIATVTFLEKIRLLRNKIVHGFGTELLDPKDILSDIMFSFSLFLGKGEWWKEIRKFHFDHPLHNFYDSSFVEANFADRLDFVLDRLGRSGFNKNSDFNVKQRVYLCPTCIINSDSDWEEYNHKWAQLEPNTPESNTIVCYNCDSTTTVIREKCTERDCKGNVIYDTGSFRNEKICLTCSMEQEIDEED